MSGIPWTPVAADPDPFPPVMVATCAEGHQWRVDVTWHPVLLRADRTWDPSQKAPRAVPRYCAQCFAQFHCANSHISLVRLEDARADLPHPQGYPR